MKKVRDFLKDNIPESFLILGVTGIFTGLYMISQPLAFISIGIVFLLCSYITLNR